VFYEFLNKKGSGGLTQQSRKFCNGLF